MQETITDQQFFDKLDALGEAKVESRLALGEWGSNCDRSRLVELWLRRKASERAAADSAKRDATEEETLSVARDANLIAKCASQAARNANIWAAIAALIAAIAMYRSMS